jgi:hypothetical protein
MGRHTAACHGRRLRGRRRVRVRRPVRPHLGADEPAPGADHAGAQRPHHGFVRQPVGIEPGAVIALDGIAIDQDVPAAECPHLPKRNGREWRAGARGHGTRLQGCLACGPDRVIPRRCRRLKSDHATDQNACSAIAVQPEAISHQFDSFVALRSRDD